MKCAHCGTRLDGEPFRYGELVLCCESMSALCSWFLDGGQQDDPEAWGDLVTNAESSEGGPPE